MPEVEPHIDPGLREANLALSGRQRREASRFASIDLRFVDAKEGAWHMAAMMSVGLLAVLCVLGLWFY
jgi:hypothetical protein